MKTCFASVAVLIVSLAVSRVGAQTPAATVARAAGDTPVAGKCLVKEDLDFIEALRNLNRPSLATDPQPPFNPDYFVGSWTFEWDVPDSPMGPAGQLTGVQTIRPVSDCVYEGTTKAKGPAGPFTVNSTIVYDRRAKYLVIAERDSRGFEWLRVGPVGGDLGGYYTHAWEAAPVTFKGQQMKLKGSTLMSSPVHFRLRAQLSVGGAPFENFGNPWFEREKAASGK
jgi:hypothetical protein